MGDNGMECLNRSFSLNPRVALGNWAELVNEVEQYREHTENAVSIAGMH
jgi:hypothetical protein